jgi:predicted ribosomally synthesized six-cysteine peptide SCIFF
MNHVKTLNTRNLTNGEGGCGECQTSCQSASKTSCGVANQPCEAKPRIRTLATRNLTNGEGGCGECQTSCQSASKTSCGVANQPCERA